MPDPGNTWMGMEPGNTWKGAPLVATVQTFEKGATGSRLYQFDYSQWAELLAGGTLASATVLADAPELVITSVAVNPTNRAQIQCRIAGGNKGKVYTLVCSAATAAGDTLTQKGSLSVT